MELDAARDALVWISRNALPGRRSIPILVTRCAALQHRHRVGHRPTAD